MKKFLAIFLTVAMLASFMVVPAFAKLGDISVWEDPSATYVADINRTGEIVDVSTATAFIVKVETKVDGKTTYVPITVDDHTVALSGLNDTKFELASKADGTALTDDKLTTGASFYVIPTSDAKKGDIVAVNVLDKAGKVIATFFAQYAKGDPDKIESIAIKKLDSDFLVASDSMTIKLDTTANNSATKAYWVADSGLVKFDAQNVGSVKVTADEDVDKLTPVTIKAVATNGMSATVTIYLTKGVPATGFSFKDSTYTVNAKPEAEVSLSSVVTPDNGVKKELRYTVTGNNVAPTTNDNEYTILDVTAGKKLTFTIDDAGKVKVATVEPGFDKTKLPLFAVVTGTITGKDDKDISASTVLKFGELDDNVSQVDIDRVPTSKTLSVGQQFQLGATVYDGPAIRKDSDPIVGAKVEWYSSNPSVATVDKATGVVTAVKTGKVSIIATSSKAPNGNGEVILTIVAKDAAVEGKIQYVTSGKLTVRALPASSSSKLGELKQGTVVDVLNVSGAWARISYDGSYGYVAVEFLSDPANFTVTSSKLAVRSFPGATATVKTLVFGETVKVIGKYASNPAWTMILLDDTTIAYVASANIADGGLTAVVLPGSLTFRVGASTTSAAYAQKLVKGQTVEVLGREGAFLKVKTAEGFVGFAAAQYLEVL